MLETTALGAACMAGIGVGVWSDEAEVAAHWQEAARFQPRMTATARAAMLERWHRAVERSRGWAEP